MAARRFWDARDGPLHGNSTVEILEPPSNNQPRTDDSEFQIQFIPGHARGNLAKPSYPAEALAGHAGRYVVYATPFIDETGRVTGVSRSLKGISLPNRFSDAFFAAVRTAVSKWSLSPPHNVYWRRDPRGEMTYLRTEALSSTMEVEFTFEESGAVR